MLADLPNFILTSASDEGFGWLALALCHGIPRLDDALRETLGPKPEEVSSRAVLADIVEEGDDPRVTRSECSGRQSTFGDLAEQLLHTRPEAVHECVHARPEPLQLFLSV